VKTSSPALICHEDEHLLVINKPAGMNTHAPSPYAGEGIYDWLRNREPRWASLAIIHRLDKETSGVMIFAKTPEANRSLTRQFAERQVKKSYTLLTDRPVKKEEFVVKSTLVRAGERYVSRPPHAGGVLAETRFRVVRREGAITMVQAEPITGRTHQIRVHAADAKIPIIGDALYGGSPSSRLGLHAETLELQHPVTDERMRLHAPADFKSDPRASLRAQLIAPEETNAWRVVHGASDGWPGWYVDRLGDFLLSQSENEVNQEQRQLLDAVDARGIYHKILARDVRKASLRLVSGEAVPKYLTILENCLRYELSFAEGYSVGLFLDQRDNRRRVLTNHVAAGFALREGGLRGAEILNAFAYTCGFSVCTAKAGARVTSVDLSKKYLDWGRRNFELNGLDTSSHDFIFGDTFDWLRRLAKKNRTYDVILLDPPTFSQSKKHGAFRAEKDYGNLVNAALPLLKPNGVLFASTNAATWAPEEFLHSVRAAIGSRNRRVEQEHYVPQPSDFPITRNEPGYLKTVWLRISG
jgi:23S rRNA (cytosine1962-C5)-methyltransferase